ncbi:hypothetical protein KA005_20760 [bacterium]|nr:hypothetical protein [bacterium]
MGEKFTKRIKIWGLLRRVAKPNKPWDFVNDCGHLFGTEVMALKQAIVFNTIHGTPAYLYKPVEVFLEVEEELNVASHDSPEK